MAAFGRRSFTEIPAQVTRAAQSNALASGYRGADKRFNTSLFDRGGVSRGAGQTAAGAMPAAESLAEGRSQSARIGFEDMDFNRNQRLASEDQASSYGLQRDSMRDQFNVTSARQDEALRRAMADYRFNNFQGAWGALTGLLR